MAGILPQDKINEAKAWLHDVFVWGGLASTPKRSVPIEKYRYMYGTHPENFRKEDKKYREAAITVCGCIRNRQVETQRFLAFDDALKTLSQCSFLPDLKATSGYVREDAATLCSFIAWFCDENKLVYNNKNTSIEEMKQIQKTLIGSTLWSNYLYAVGNTPENNPNNKVQADTATTQDTATNNQAPKQAAPQQSTTPGAPLPNGTKQSDPRHTLYRSNAKGLVDYSRPKETNIGTGGKMFRVAGKGKTPTEIVLNVQPEIGKVPLKVRYSVGSAWNDCKLYFKTNVEADRFMGKALAAKPNDVSILYVKAGKEDPNGYVEVITEFGNAYIVASKLHEDLEEEIEEKDEQPKVTNKEIWEAFKEGFFSD